MSVEVSLNIGGLDQLIEELPEQADAAVRAIALDVEAEAKRRAPVDTGYLRNSIHMRDPKRGDFEAQVDVDADYGIYVHEGAQGRRPVPFLEQAVDAAIGRASSRLEALAKKMEGN